jgi:hypothetical protein
VPAIDIVGDPVDAAHGRVVAAGCGALLMPAHDDRNRTHTIGGAVGDAEILPPTREPPACLLSLYGADRTTRKITLAGILVVEPAGIEPATSCLQRAGGGDAMPSDAGIARDYGFASDLQVV